MEDLTLEEFAKVTGRHVETLRRLARMGRLPAYKVGGRWLIARENVMRLRRVQESERMT